jgi:leucyl-tRNA synthetase
VEKTYNPSEIEAKYRQIWEDKNLFSSDNQTQTNQSQNQNKILHIA